MSTSSLFVELMVIGVGGSAWLMMLLAWGLNVNVTQIKPFASSPIVSIAALALTYLIGILVDRLADAAFSLARADRKLLSLFNNYKSYLDARTKVLAKSPPLANLHEYNRSRQRICRGWTVNFILLALIVGLRIPPSLFDNVDRTISTASGAFLLFMALACWFAWESLYGAELCRVKDHLALLENRPRSITLPEPSNVGDSEDG